MAFGDALRRSREEQIPLTQAERAEYGVTHAEIGAYLLGLWGLPYPIVEAVAHHHEPRRVAQRGLDVLCAVHVADELIHEAEPERSLDPAPRPPLDVSYLAELGLAERLPDWREIVANQICATNQEMGTMTRARRGA
jgi:HD-like signal output (HDOD) protein